MLAVVDDARVAAGPGVSPAPESFGEVSALVAGTFGNAAGRGV